MGVNSRVVFGGILLVGFCCFLLIGVSTTTRVPMPPTARVGVSDSREGATQRHEGMVVNYVSKDEYRMDRILFTTGKSGTPHNRQNETKFGLKPTCVHGNTYGNQLRGITLSFYGFPSVHKKKSVT